MCRQCHAKPHNALSFPITQYSTAIVVHCFLEQLEQQQLAGYQRCPYLHMLPSPPKLATICLQQVDLCDQWSPANHMLSTTRIHTGVEDFVLFVPDARKTPALRAGTVDPNDPYQFAMPPTWREGKVANIQSGSYCQVLGVAVENVHAKHYKTSFVNTASLCRAVGGVCIRRRHGWQSTSYCIPIGSPDKQAVGQDNRYWHTRGCVGIAGSLYHGDVPGPGRCCCCGVQGCGRTYILHIRGV